MFKSHQGGRQPHCFHYLIYYCSSKGTFFQHKQDVEISYSPSASAVCQCTAMIFGLMSKSCLYTQHEAAAMSGTQ